MSIFSLELRHDNGHCYRRTTPNRTRPMRFTDDSPLVVEIENVIIPFHDLIFTRLVSELHTDERLEHLLPGGQSLTYHLAQEPPTSQ
jgi:hypothetical protein